MRIGEGELFAPAPQNEPGACDSFLKTDCGRVAETPRGEVDGPGHGIGPVEIKRETDFVAVGEPVAVGIRVFRVRSCGSFRRVGEAVAIGIQLALSQGVWGKSQEVE